MMTLVFISSNLLGCLIASVTLSNVDSHYTFPRVKNDKRILAEIVGKEDVGALLEKPEDFDNSCPASSERWEWLQYLVWLNNYSDLNSIFEHNSSPSKFLQCRYDSFEHTITYDLSHIDGATELVRIVITELLHYVPTQGGSSFRITATSDLHKQNCPVKDYLNGTYLACCSIDKTQNIDQYTIKASIQFAEFKAFSTDYLSTDQEISTRQFVVHKNHHEKRYPKCKHSNSVKIDAGYWNKNSPLDEDYTQYILKDSNAKNHYCVFKDLEIAKLSECLEIKYNHHVTMLGDSHIRYAFLRLVNLPTGLKIMYKKIQEDFVYLKHHFKWKPFCNAFAKGLYDYLQYREEEDKTTTSSPTRHHLVVLGIGHWDIRDKSPEIFLNCLANDVLPLLRQLIQLPQTKVIWQDMTPVPSLLSMKDSRNNYLLGAMNYAVSILLKPVIRVPAFAIALPFSEELISNRMHLMQVHMRGYLAPGTLQVLPPGRVVNDLIGYHACIA